jgi:hypothetical protein
MMTDTAAMKIGPTSPVAPALGRHAPHRASPAGHKSFLEVLGETRGAPVAPRPSPVPPAATAPTLAASPPSSGSPLARSLSRALDGVVAGGARVDALLDAAARGRTFTASEMIAMQATVFRYSQTVEVLSRATDRLVGAIKQTLGTSV